MYIFWLPKSDFRVKFSIITVVYNGGDTIKDTILSIHNQDYSDYEHIIIDGASSDNTLEVIYRYMNEKTLLISEPDNGLYFALNKGIKLSTGDVICFLHSDDVYTSKSVLGNIANIFLSHKVDLVYGNLNYVRKNNNSVIRRWQSRKYQIGDLQAGWSPPHPSIFTRFNFMKSHGYFNTSYEISSDYDQVIRLFSLPKLIPYHFNEVLVNMKLGGISNRPSKLILKMYEDYKIINSHNLNGIYTLICKNLSKFRQFFNQSAK
jgi:glycosyltransferase